MCNLGNSIKIIEKQIGISTCLVSEEKKWGLETKKTADRKRAWEGCLPSKWYGTLKNIMVQNETFMINVRFYSRHPDECRYRSASSKKRDDPFLGFSDAAGSSR